MARRRRNARAVPYTAALAKEICDRIAEGEIWSHFAGSRGMPNYRTLYNWRTRYPAFGEMYDQALAAGTEVRADKVLAISQAATRETVQQDRLHVGSLKWHVTRADGLRKNQAVWKTAKGRKLTVHVRQFERAWREDGTAYVREVRMKPEGGEA